MDSQFPRRRPERTQSFAQEAVVRSPADASPRLRAGDETLEEVVVHTSRYALIADLAGGVASNGFSSFGPVRGGEPNETAIVRDGHAGRRDAFACELGPVLSGAGRQ